MGKIVREYPCKVVAGLRLSFENLWAGVSLAAGAAGTAFIKITGDEKLLSDIAVNATPRDITIKGNDRRGSGGVTVISGRGNRISVSNVRGNGVIVSGDSVISIGSGMKRTTVIVDGKVVSGDVSATTIDELPQIHVTVPKGTDLEVYDVEKLDSRGLGGKLVCSLSGQGSLTASDVRELKAKCSGQTECRIMNVVGDAKLNASGQSSIEVQGNLNDVEADASGQSGITINGNCRDFSGDTSGQSHIDLLGKASGRVRHKESGQSRISLR